MNKRFLVINVYLLALIFSILFYRKSIGFNLVIFETLILIYWTWKLKGKVFLKPLRYLWLGAIISAFAVAMHGSMIAKIVNITSVFVLNGFLIIPQLRSITEGLIPAAENIFSGPLDFFRSHSVLIGNGRSTGRIFGYVRITLVPLVIIVVFAGLYSMASSFFGDHLSNFLSQFTLIGDWFNSLFSSGKFWVFVLGMIISAMLIVHVRSSVFSEEVAPKNDDLFRVRKRYPYLRFFKMNALKSEMKAGIFLFAVLNLLIFFMNVLDLQHVWLGFEWGQQYLKEFVHEGTYILIFSILIAMIVVLFYFRKNLNFIQNNGLLKKLAIIWVIQNMFLVVSVGMRNFWYIKYYNLAYLRIGVIFFLIVVMIGLFMIIRKIRERRSAFFLIRKTSLAFYISLIGLAMVNWDSAIAKFNFSRHHEAFIHFDFMANLSDKALPYLDKSELELAKMEAYQGNNWSSIRSRNYYMGPEDHKKKIDQRISRFIHDYEKVHWLSKDLATIQAHNLLIDKYGDLGKGENRN